MSISLKAIREEFYTESEAAIALGISRMTLWRWIKAGKVKTERLWGAVLIEKTDLERLRR